MSERCLFCKTILPADPRQISSEGWVPSFWTSWQVLGHNAQYDPASGFYEVIEPVCGQCCTTHLHFNDDFGDMELTTVEICI